MRKHGLAVLLCSTMCAAATVIPVEAATASSSLPSSITVWSYYGTPPYLKYEKDAAALFNAKFPSVKVNYVNVPNTALDGKVLAAGATHNGPDVLIDNPNVDWPEFSSAGVLGNMSPYVSQLGSPLPFPSDVVYKYDGKIETIQNYLNFLGFWYNKTLLGKLHLSVPTTVAQMNNDMAVAKKAGYQPLLLNTDPGSEGIWEFIPWMTNRGLSYCSLNSASSEPTLASILSQFRTWYQNGYEPKDADTLSAGTILPIFLAGKTLFMQNGNWDVSSMKGLSFQAGDTVIPSDPYPSKVLLGGEGEAIGAYSQYPAIAFDYLKYGWFSVQGDKNTITDIGSFPTRTDLKSYISSLPYEKAFVEQESHGFAPYPANKEISKIADDMGNIFSGFTAGSGTPMGTAKQMVSTMQADISAGGGSCATNVHF